MTVTKISTLTPLRFLFFVFLFILFSYASPGFMFTINHSTELIPCHWFRNNLYPDWCLNSYFSFWLLTRTTTSQFHFHLNIIQSLQSKYISDWIIFPPQPGPFLRFTQCQHSLSQQDSSSGALIHFTTKAFFYPSNLLPGVHFKDIFTKGFIYVIAFPFFLSKWAIILSKQTIITLNSKQRFWCVSTLYHQLI